MDASQAAYRRTPTETSKAILDQSTQQQQINMQLVERLGGVNVELNALRTEQKAGFASMSASIDHLRADNERQAKESARRAEESKSREEIANSTLSDIKNLLQQQASALTEQAELSKKRQARHESIVDKFLDKFLWPVLGAVALVIVLYIKG